MSSYLFVDTGPLIALAKAGLLDTNAKCWCCRSFPSETGDEAAVPFRPFSTGLW
jgi:hypothetical protein